MDDTIKITKSINWHALKQINCLIAGARDSGKSFLALYLIVRLIRFSLPTQLFVIDPKRSDLSRFSKILPPNRVASDKEEIFALLDRYLALMKKRANFVLTQPFGATAASLGIPLYYLVYDEFGALTSLLNSKERKEHDALLSQIALMGRQFGFGLICLMQQSSVVNGGLSTAVKQQFGMVAHMGNASSDYYRSTFGSGIQLPAEELGQGEGLSGFKVLAKGSCALSKLHLSIPCAYGNNA